MALSICDFASKLHASCYKPTTQEVIYQLLTTGLFLIFGYSFSHEVIIYFFALSQCCIDCTNF